MHQSGTLVKSWLLAFRAFPWAANFMSRPIRVTGSNSKSQPQHSYYGFECKSSVVKVPTWWT